MCIRDRKWTDKTLEGESDMVGSCRLAIAEIRELRIGKAATDATDIAYADWVARPAPAVAFAKAAAGGDSSSGQHSPLVGTQAENFKIKRMDGSEFELSKHRGKVVVLDFWATWCGPCIGALPQMINATSSFDPNQVVFLAVNQLEDPETIELFLKKKGWKMPVGLDSGNVGPRFNVSAIPQSVIIDKDGQIAFLEVGGGAGLEEKMFNAIRTVAGDGALKQAE